MKLDDDGNDVESKETKCRLVTMFNPVVTWVKKHFLLGVGFFVVAILTAFGEDVYSYLSKLWKNKPDPPDWTISMSLAVPHCHAGSLSVMFRGYEPAINWGDGADRLAICASALIQAAKEDVPLLLEERFPECLSVYKVSDSYTIETNLDSPAVCRAPYRYNQDSLVETSLPNGLFICMPGYQREESQVSYRQDDVEVPVCNEEDLKKYNFL